MLRSRRKSRNRAALQKQTDPEKEALVPTEEPLSERLLTGTTAAVHRVIFLPERDLVVAASWDNYVRVYHVDTSGEPCAVFKKHTGFVAGVVHLKNELLASLDTDKRLFVWRATTAEIVSEWEHSTALHSIEKLADSKIVVGDEDGNVLVLTHQAASFQVHRLPNSHTARVYWIVLQGDYFITSSDDSTTKVWDINSLTLRATLPPDDWVLPAIFSNKSIITRVVDMNISVFHNVHNCIDLQLPVFCLGADFLNNDVVLACGECYLYLISAATKTVLSRMWTKKTLLYFLELPDGRIAVSGYDGYCAIITPPKSMQGPIEDKVTSSYPTSAIAHARVPLQLAWLAVQERRLTLLEACKSVITSENCARSLDEWCIAHHLLMEAVKRGEIPASRHLDDSIAHWHQFLYQHCAQLVMGKKCIDGVKLLFKEAEDAGVIAKGQIESLINTIGIRRDMDTDNKFLVHAAYQLFMKQAEMDDLLQYVFMKQAEMDDQLQEVLRYQRFQKVAALLNAFIGCIPVGGAVATNVIFSGASILYDLQVCGLVESALGIAHDASGGFGCDTLFDRFLRRTNSVMTVENWRKVDVSKRKVVEDAASALGLSIDELRKKLLIVASMKSEEYGPPSNEVVMEEADEDTSIQPLIAPEAVTEGVSSLTLENPSGCGTGAPKADENITVPISTKSELMQWKAEGVSKNVVGQLESREAAACFTAFVLNYEYGRGESFTKLKEKMQEVFEKKHIYGATFVEADEEEKSVLVGVLMKALKDVMDEDAMVLTKMWVKKFIRLASQ